MPHTHHAAVESLSVSAALILGVLVYVQGWFLIRRRELYTIESWRAASFLVGAFSLWLALASPLAALDHELLTVHMIQHLLLMTLAPPLIWLGKPLKPLRQGLPQRFVEVMSQLFHSVLVRRLGRAIGSPAVCWLAATGTLVGWHVPTVLMLGLRSEVWHGVEQGSFLATGLLFWWPVVEPWPRDSNRSEWLILLYLFLATLPCDILSGFLVFCDRVVYPIYFSSSRPFGFSALQDQQYAGALMWTCVTVVYLIAGTIVTARLLSPEKPHQWIVRSDSQGSTAAQTTGESMEVV